MYDPKADLQNSTTIEKDGMTFVIERSDPPFFRIKTSFKLPDRYTGEYTTVDFAEKAINEYCASYKEVVKDLQQVKKAKKVA
jgi:hypothetical protein